MPITIRDRVTEMLISPRRSLVLCLLYYHTHILALQSRTIKGYSAARSVEHS